MIKVPLSSVRALSLREIAELWAPTAEIPVSVMLRELRVAVINIPRLWGGRELLKSIPPDSKLPNPDTRVDRRWLMEFCGKQDWDKPEFWFPLQVAARRPGRPSLKNIVISTFKCRRKMKRVERTISAEGRAIHDELAEKYPGKIVPQGKTIQAHIREEWHQGS